MNWLLATMLLAGGEPAVAMVLEAASDATVQVGKGKVAPLRGGDLLPPGAVVQSGKSDTVLFILQAAASEIVNRKTRVVVEADGCSPTSARTRVARKTSMATLKRLRKIVGERGGAAVVRRGPPEDTIGANVNPLDTSFVANTRPSFRWAPAAGAELYEVRFFSGDDATRKKEWTATTREPKLDYPRAAPSLAPGACRQWEVWVKKKGEAKLTELVSSCEVSVMDKGAARGLAEVKALAASKGPGDRMLAALLAESLGEFELALKLYEQLDKDRPGRREVLRALEHYYRLARDRSGVERIKVRLKKLDAPRK